MQKVSLQIVILLYLGKFQSAFEGTVTRCFVSSYCSSSNVAFQLSDIGFHATACHAVRHFHVYSRIHLSITTSEQPNCEELLLLTNFTATFTAILSLTLSIWDHILRAVIPTCRLRKSYRSPWTRRPFLNVTITPLLTKKLLP